MKGLLTNLPVFILAFLLVTFGMFYMNVSYKNIWKGDFTPVGIKTVVKVPLVTKIKKREVKEFLLQKIEPELKKHFEQFQPKKIVDTIYQNIVIDEALLDSFKTMNMRIAKLQEEIKTGIAQVRKLKSKKKPQALPVKENKKSKGELKKTAKLLESMNPKRAAKVISYYSDNKARDILMLMNKKKAAQLMENMEPAKIAKIMSES